MLTQFVKIINEKYMRLMQLNFTFTTRWWLFQASLKNTMYTAT